MFKFGGVDILPPLNSPLVDGRSSARVTTISTQHKESIM